MMDLLKYTSNKTIFSGVAIWLKKVHFLKYYKSTHNKDDKITQKVVLASQPHKKALQ